MRDAPNEVIIDSQASIFVPIMPNWRQDPIAALGYDDRKISIA